MLMPWIGEGQHEPTDICLLEERQYVGERDVAIVRPLVISPADVEPHPVARHIYDCLVDCCDDALDKAKKLAKRTIVVCQMPLEREIRAIELQKKTALDDGLVFDLDGGSDGGEICLFAVVIFVFHCGGNDPGRRGGHERLDEAVWLRFEGSAKIGD